MSEKQSPYQDPSSLDEKQLASYSVPSSQYPPQQQPLPGQYAPQYAQQPQYPPVVPMQPGFRTQFASLSLHMTDRIRFLQFPQPVIANVEATIKNVWPKGIQDVRPYHGSHEVKLRGNPWYGQSDDAVHSRRLMNHVLASLFQQGWVLSLSTDISKKAMDKDTLVFRKQDPPPPPAEWFCISFSKTDRIRFIDAPEQVVAGMLARFQPECQSHSKFRLPGVYELKMKGYPWMASGSDTMYARSLILKLIEGLETHGFTVYASIDQKTGTGSDNHRGETDTFHCCRTVGWQPGLPVYHT